MAEINAAVYATEQALLVSYHRNYVAKSITGSTSAEISPVRTSMTDNTVPRMLLNNINQAVLTNLNKRLYEAPTRHVSKKYA